jgi:hypothetical protein
MMAKILVLAMMELPDQFISANHIDPEAILGELLKLQNCSTL